MPETFNLYCILPTVLSAQDTEEECIGGFVYGTDGNAIMDFALEVVSKTIEQILDETLKHIMLIGFGGGLAWGGCVVDMKKRNGVTQ